MHEIVDYHRKVSVFHTTLNTDNKFLESKIDAEQKRDPVGDAKRAVQAWRTDTYLHFRDKEYTPFPTAFLPSTTSVGPLAPSLSPSVAHVPPPPDCATHS